MGDETLRIDLRGTLATAGVSEHQATHTAKIKGYVSRVCGRTEAFSGVLNLFEGSYTEALTTVEAGMDDSGAIAEHWGSETRGSVFDYITTDEDARDQMRRISDGTVVDFVYGADAGATFTTGGDVRIDVPDDGKNPFLQGHDAFKEGKRTVDPLLNATLPEAPPSAAPDWAKKPGDHIKDYLNELRDQGLADVGARINRDEYLANRAAGMSAEDAYRHATDDEGLRADERRDLTYQREQQDAYDDAYDAARSSGATEHEADVAASHTRDGVATGQADDDRVRRETGDGVAGMRDDVNNITGTVDSVRGLVEESKELGDNLDDYEKYDEAERGGVDEDLKGWAGR